MAYEDFMWWMAASAAAVALNVPFGRLRRGALRHSSRWFACLMAPIFLLAATRNVLALPWVTAVPLLFFAVAGQAAGRTLGGAAPATDALRWRVAAYATFLAGLLLLLGPPARAHDAHTEKDYQRLEANEPAPSFTLRDQDGRKTSLVDFRGNVVVLTFFYSTCVDICPVLFATLEAAHDKLSLRERERVRFVAITVDAGRDTSERLKAFMATRELTAGTWTLLTGSVAELTDVAADYGVVVRPGPAGDIVHNSVFVVIDPAGNERAELHGAATPVDALVDDVRRALH